jgi:hypothetical protein
MGRSLKKPVYKKPATRGTKKTVRTKKSKATKKQQNNRKRYSKLSSKRRQSRKGTKKKKKTSTTSRGKKRTKKQKGVQEGGYLKTLDKQISHFNNNLKKVYEKIKTIYNIIPVVKDEEFPNTCNLTINNEIYNLTYLKSVDGVGGFSFTYQLHNETNQGKKPKFFRTIAEVLFYLIPRTFKLFENIHKKYIENENKFEIQPENYKDVKTDDQFKIKDEELLKDKQTGTYFLRNSTKSGNFTLVIKAEHNGKPVIKKLDITYNVNDEKYYYGDQVLEPNMYYYFKKISKTPSDVPLTNLLNDPNYPEMGYKYLNIINSGYTIFTKEKKYNKKKKKLTLF